MTYQPNTIINDRYRLLSSIGRGSFGEVWLATDLTLGIYVALKIYIALDSIGLEEFKNEFKNSYNLHHPNLLKADYFDSVGNNPYLVMPYCPTAVSSLVGKIDEESLWTLIRDVASGLSYLHENDIIHRDIKPDNILRDEQGNYVITDFGLSMKMRSTLRRASARGADQANVQAGTIGYMAPEMFSSKPEAVKATDIWALGATIYEMATGEMPFCGQGGVMELHGAEIPGLHGKYSKQLEQLMAKCLAKDPWDRPTAKTVLEIATAHGRNEKTNHYVDPKEPKKRNGFISFWLWFCLVINVLCALVYFALMFSDTGLYSGYPEPFMLRLFWLVASILNVTGFAMLIKWKKAGFYLVAGTAIVNAIVNCLSLGSATYLISPFITIIVLRLILQIKKDGESYWESIS